MDKKTYKFSYGNNFKKYSSKFIFFIYNLIISNLLLMIIGTILSRINYELKAILPEEIISIIKVVEIYAAIPFVGFFIVSSFLPQKAVISNGKIKVYRHCLFFNFIMIFRGFNDNIPISKIKEVYRPNNKNTYLQPIPVCAIDWDNMVIITLDNASETRYYIPVENSEDFIEEVNKQRKILKGQTDDNTIC